VVVVTVTTSFVLASRVEVTRTVVLETFVRSETVVVDVTTLTQVQSVSLAGKAETEPMAARAEMRRVVRMVAAVVGVGVGVGGSEVWKVVVVSEWE